MLTDNLVDVRPEEDPQVDDAFFGTYYCLQSLLREPPSYSSLTAPLPSTSFGPITLDSWSREKDGREEEGKGEDLTFVVTEDGQRWSKTIAWIDELKFLAESPLLTMLREGGCSNSCLDLSQVVISEWETVDQQVFATREDVELILDFWLNGRSLWRHPRAPYLFRLLIGHLYPSLTTIR